MSAEVESSKVDDLSFGKTRPQAQRHQEAIDF